MAVSRKMTNGVLVFSALVSTYVAIKGSPELVELIRKAGSVFK